MAEDDESSGGLLALLVFVLILVGLGKLAGAVARAADKSK